MLLGHTRRSSTATRPSNHKTNKLTHNNHKGRQASSLGMALALKKGIIRCETVANTLATKHQIEPCVAILTQVSSPDSNPAAASHRPTTPAQKDSTMTLACALSRLGL